MPRQLIGEFKPGEPMMPGYAERIDYEYVRNRTCNILMATEPLRGWRMAEVTETRTIKDWVLFTEKIIEAYPEAEKKFLSKITSVQAEAMANVLAKLVKNNETLKPIDSKTLDWIKKI